MTALRRVGVPYTDAEIAKAAADVAGKTEMEAVIAYLQGLGLALPQTQPVAQNLSPPLAQTAAVKTQAAAIAPAAAAAPAAN